MRGRTGAPPRRTRTEQFPECLHERGSRGAHFRPVDEHELPEETFAAGRDDEEHFASIALVASPREEPSRRQAIRQLDDAVMPQLHALREGTDRGP